LSSPNREDGHSRSVTWATITALGIKTFWDLVLIGLGIWLIFEDHPVWGGILLTIGIFF
jgi:hypothetical protein